MKKIIFKITSIFVLTVLSSILIINYTISRNTSDKLYDSTLSIPINKYGLILGTSKTSRSGKDNHYFVNRIDAAVALINAGKIQYLVISGDNKNEDYNEIKDIKEALLKKGISSSILLYDPKGFDTYKSIDNLSEWLKKDTVTIISQKFHNQRAVFIANEKGINAIGYNAKSVSKSYGFLTSLREHLARIKMIFDLYIF